MTLKLMFKKYKPKREIEFRSVYFNSTTRTGINQKLVLKMLFKKICTGFMIEGLMKDLARLLNS